tara:strand:- start:780 stop:1205 length:426 start_codon:yes stop_codon:yes gene_type:complete
MGNVQSPKKVNYEDIQLILNKKKSNILLINTLSLNEQNCLIPNTINAYQEEKIINTNLKNTTLEIVIYGKNNSDKNVEKKYLKLRELGFDNIYIYPGGLFEWLCLQDIYGSSSFPTTIKELDILKYKSKSQFCNYMITTID